MRSLDTAREVCDQYHPGLCKSLAEIDLMAREMPGSPIIDLFRAHGGPSLLVPTDYAGDGVDALTAVRVQRALASYSPSLGAAVTMHHFTMAMLFSLARTAERLTPAQLELLSRIAPEQLLVASGWAEGKPDQNILVPAVTAVPADNGGYVVNGGKKPCSLSRSMDLLTASVAVPIDGEPTLAVLLIPAESPGVSVHPFWSSVVLGAAESDEVRLTDVHVPEELVIRTVPDDPDRLDDLQTAGFVWFEMLISSVYVGAASALVERALERGRGSVTDRAAASVQLEAAVALLEGVARAVSDGVSGDEAVASVLLARYAAQEALASATDKAAELLGGIAFMQSSEIAYLLAASRPLAYHPPSRGAAAEALVNYACGAPLRLA
jgi:alkylation response protein AidB-like acyl-CoA dehydrogenase